MPSITCTGQEVSFFFLKLRNLFFRKIKQKGKKSVGTATTTPERKKKTQPQLQPQLQPPPPPPTTTTTIATSPKQTKLKDVVHLLHVVPRVRSTAAPSGALYYAPPTSCPDEAKNALEKAARAFITREFASLIADRALPANALAVDVVHELAGSSAGESVGDAILRTAEELDAAALVMLSHEKKRLEQLIWGSVSKEVASRTKRPVVLVH